MKVFVTTLALLSLLTTAGAQTNQEGVAMTSDATPTTRGATAPTVNISRNGSRPSSKAPAECFTGNVRVDPLFQADPPSRSSGACVTFEPGARSAWHTHPLGQRLVVTAGSGRVQFWCGPVEDITDNVLFGDVWERPGLSKRDRSLVTVSALIAMNRPDQLRSHLARARDNGVTPDELVEAITHLAFYAGWPSAVTAASVAKEVVQAK
jgi:alkylhydroperoxidase/carboxymuconolactone decarboxylase family protein YurZ